MGWGHCNPKNQRRRADSVAVKYGAAKLHQMRATPNRGFAVLSESLRLFACGCFWSPVRLFRPLPFASGCVCFDLFAAYTSQRSSQDLAEDAIDQSQHQAS